MVWAFDQVYIISVSVGKHTLVFCFQTYYDFKRFIETFCIWTYNIMRT